MSPNKLHLECSLDKELYYHGETISVNVHIQVNSKGVNEVLEELVKLTVHHSYKLVGVCIHFHFAYSMDEVELSKDFLSQH